MLGSFWLYGTVSFYTPGNARVLVSARSPWYGRFADSPLLSLYKTTSCIRYLAFEEKCLLFNSVWNFWREHVSVHVLYDNQFVFCGSGDYFARRFARDYFVHHLFAGKAKASVA